MTALNLADLARIQLLFRGNDMPSFSYTGIMPILMFIVFSIIWLSEAIRLQDVAGFTVITLGAAVVFLA